jgi:hypothetical protein
MARLTATTVRAWSVSATPGQLESSLDASTFAGTSPGMNGTKNFKIDHPLDPQNKYLLHSCVESSERKNVYDGVAQLDGDGAAWVDLPEWFEALNADYRYQLTAVGGAAPDLHVAEEVSDNRIAVTLMVLLLAAVWQRTRMASD